MTIGERVRRRREELNLSQEELAKKCGYKSRSSINKIETARSLPLSRVEIMAKALETTPADLMGWVEPEMLYGYSTQLTNTRFDSYGARGFWAYRVLEVGDNIPQEGKNELVSFAEFLATKYGVSHLSTKEEVDNMYGR